MPIIIKGTVTKSDDVHLSDEAKPIEVSKTPIKSHDTIDLNFLPPMVEKDANDIKTSNFYHEIIKQLQSYAERYNARQIILASPAFWKEELLKELKDEILKKKIVLATCSATGENGIDEVLKRDEVKTALKQDRTINEINLVENLFVNIAKNELAVYGLKETEEAINMGAVSQLLITDNLILTSRQNNTYKKLDELIKNADKTKAEIHIVSSEHEGGKKLDGLGGIAALLRFKVRY